MTVAVCRQVSTKQSLLSIAMISQPVTLIGTNGIACHFQAPVGTVTSHGQAEAAGMFLALLDKGNTREFAPI